MTSCIRITSKKRLFSIDFIRSISLLFVFIYHFNIHMLITRGKDALLCWNGNEYIDLGQIAVGLFLVVSGYCNMMASGNESIRGFYKKRLLRIYPLFYVSYIFCLLMLVIFNGSVSFQAAPIKFFLTLLGLDGYFLYRTPTFYVTGEWFLGALLMFYAVFPFLRVLTNRIPLTALAASFLMYFISHENYQSFFKMYEWYHLVTLLPLFMYGICAQKFEEKKSFLFYTTSIALSGCYLVFGGDVITMKIVVCIFLYALIMFVFRWSVLASSTLSFFVKIADISFPIFLVHHVIIRLAAGPISVLLGVNNNYLLFVISLIIATMSGIFCMKIESLFVRK